MQQMLSNLINFLSDMHRALGRIPLSEIKVTQFDFALCETLGTHIYVTY